MKFADLRPVPLHNINHMVPDVDAPDGQYYQRDGRVRGHCGEYGDLRGQ